MIDQVIEENVPKDDKFGVPSLRIPWLFVGATDTSKFVREVGQFILGAFPTNERLIFNRTYAGYRGSLTFTEDIYDNN